MLLTLLLLRFYCSSLNTCQTLMATIELFLASSVLNINRKMTSLSLLSQKPLEMFPPTVLKSACSSVWHSESKHSNPVALQLYILPSRGRTWPYFLLRYDGKSLWRCADVFLFLGFRAGGLCNYSSTSTQLTQLLMEAAADSLDLTDNEQRKAKGKLFLILN